MDASSRQSWHDRMLFALMLVCVCIALMLVCVLLQALYGRWVLGVKVTAPTWMHSARHCMCLVACTHTHTRRDDEGYSDDEDMSWKVRRAAVKTLNALVATYADALPQLYEAAAEKLVQRFQVRAKDTHTHTHTHTHESRTEHLGAMCVPLPKWKCWTRVQACARRGAPCLLIAWLACTLHSCALCIHVYRIGCLYLTTRPREHSCTPGLPLSTSEKARHALSAVHTGA